MSNVSEYEWHIAVALTSGVMPFIILPKFFQNFAKRKIIVCLETFHDYFFVFNSPLKWPHLKKPWVPHSQRAFSFFAFGLCRKF